MERTNYNSKTKWEDWVGYSRAVRIGNHIYVSGTTATDENGEIVGHGDAYHQTQQALSNIEKALQQLGASIENVVRTRLFITDFGRSSEISKAYKEVFGEIRPATSMVEISRLIHHDMLIEIEAEAVLD